MSNEGYTLSGYGSMIADRVRMEAYTQALRSAIQPGALVMDIGTGPGIMAVLACQLGASRVYAIEPSEIIQVAREISAANGCADKIVFLEDISTKITIPQPVDVIVSDMRGVLSLHENHIPSIADARRRFLAPGGTLIARRDHIWAAIVEIESEYSNIVDPWDRNALGQDLGCARRRALNEIRKVRAKPEQLLSAPQEWATLDYTNVEDPDVRGNLEWTVERDGVGHGVVVWFDAELTEGIGFSNSPTAPEAIYGQAFFPWLEPVVLTTGQAVRVDLQAKLLERDYFWRWTTCVESATKPSEVSAQFDQSLLGGGVLSAQKLRKRASTYVPQLTEDGMALRRALELMDGKASLEEIARNLTAEFPAMFSRWQEALSFAGSVSKESSR